MNARTIGFIVVASGLAVISAGAIQNPTKSSDIQQTAQIKVKTELVQLRAVVTDRRGELVDNLSKEDFVLLEDGVPQSISFFAVDRVPDRSAPAPARERKAAPETNARPEFPIQGASISRSVVLLVDTLHTSFESLAAIREALHRFVDKQMTDRDVVAVKTVTGMLGVLEQFTQDKKILRIGIDKILPWRITNTDSLFTPYLAGRIMRNDQTAIQLGMQILKVEEGTDIPDGTIPKALDDIPISESSIASLMNMASIMTKAKAELVLSESRYWRLVLTGTAAAVVDKLAEMPGQRMIAMFSDGFTSVEPSGQTDVADLQPVISRAAQSGISFYTFNAKGLTIPMLKASMAGASIAGATRIDRTTDDLMVSLSQSQHDLENAMGVLAAETGGEYFTNTNDLAGRMQQMLDSNKIGYDLAYYLPRDKDPTKVRHIAITIRNHPEYKVRAQRSYVLSDLQRPETESEPQTTQGRLHRAMSEPLPVTDIRVTAAGQTAVDVEPKKLDVWIKGEDLSFSQEGEQRFIHVEVETVIFDSQGKSVKASREELNRPVSLEEIEKLKQKDLQYVSRLSLGPGIYHVRIGIRDVPSGRMGTAIAWLEIPKTKKSNSK